MIYVITVIERKLIDMDNKEIRERLFKLQDKKYKEWYGTDMQQYLRPKTLFNRTNCENYTNSLGEVKEKSAKEIWAEKEKQKQIEEAEERRRREEEDRKFREEHPNLDMEKFHQLLRAGRFEEAHDYISKN